MSIYSYSVCLSATSEPEKPPPYDFTGAYHNDGYGTFVLCNTTSTSHYCNEVLSDFAAVDAQGPPREALELYGAWPRLWTSHIRLVHINGTRFDCFPTQLFPRGFGKNTTAFETFESRLGYVDFVVEGGVVIGAGLSDTVGERTNLEKKGGSVEETADAWFVRV